MNNEWIKLEDKRPKRIDLGNGISRSEPVLIALPEGEMTIASLIHDKDINFTYWLNEIGDYRYNFCLVTHWQELPIHPSKL